MTRQDSTTFMMDCCATYIWALAGRGKAIIVLTVVWLVIKTHRGISVKLKDFSSPRNIIKPIMKPANVGS